MDISAIGGKGLAYEKITCSGSYHSIRDEMIEGVNSAGWGSSRQYQSLSDFEKKLLMGFVNNSVLSAYRLWVEDGKRIALEEVIEKTNRIVLGGVNGFFLRSTATEVLTGFKQCAAKAEEHFYRFQNALCSLLRLF